MNLHGARRLRLTSAMLLTVYFAGAWGGGMNKVEAQFTINKKVDGYYLNGLVVNTSALKTTNMRLYTGPECAACHIRERYVGIVSAMPPLQSSSVSIYLMPSDHLEKKGTNIASIIGELRAFRDSIEAQIDAQILQLFNPHASGQELGKIPVSQ